MADSVAIATHLLRAFVKNFWGRYLFDTISQIPNEKLRTALAALLQESEGDFEKFRVAIENWFDDSMDRVSGWYKRHTQWVQLLLGVALTFALNLDSVLIVKVLSRDNSGLLKAAVAEAQKFAEGPSVVINAGGAPQASPTPASANAPSPAETLRLLRAQFNALNLPIGWVPGPPVKHKAQTSQTGAGNTEKPAAEGEAKGVSEAKAVSGDNTDFRHWPGWTCQGEKFPQWLSNWLDTIHYHFFGWLLTAIAVSMGAPFWFDLLSKFTSIRASGDPPPQQTKT